jgi:hypothetical protein
MKMKILAAAVVVSIGALSATASSAATYDFSYEFASGDLLAGTLEGSLQADNDTIWISDFGSVDFLGVTLPDISPTDIRSSSDYPDGLLQPLVSLSGSVLDVFVCALGFSGTGNCDIAADGGFVLDTSQPLFGAGDGTGGRIFEGSRSGSSWTITEVAAVPLPAALPMLLAGLGGMGLMARRKRKAA